MTDLKEYFKMDEEKIDKASKYTGASGGRLSLPAIGEVITITVVGEPVLVKNDKLPKGEGLFMKVEMNGIDFDMPVTRTIAFGLEKEKRKYGFGSFKGKTFKIMAKAWDSEEFGKSKTYAVIYQSKPVNLAEEEPEEVIESVDI